MEHITIKEYAALRGCSERNVRKMIADGQLAYELSGNANRNQTKYLIPVSELPDRLQAKHYGAKAGSAAAMVAQPKALEDYTADERAQIKLWSELLEEWQRYRNDPAQTSKAGVDKAFCAMLTLTRPELQVSEPTLYRKWRAYRMGDLDGLVDKRGKWRKGRTDMPKELWDAFLDYYLDQRQYPISKCVEYVGMWAKEYHPDLIPQMPSYHAFRRQVQTIEAPVRVLMREGEKAYSDRCAPYIERLYDDLASNDYWIADNHTFDVITQSEDGEAHHRLYLTAFIDARSQIFTGWHVTDAPCSDATLFALRKGILRFGIPRHILVDNGREFLNRDIGGLGHRQKASTKDLPEPPPIFARLGIEMRNAIVRNAKAKPIERTFLDLKNSLSRLFETYTGGNAIERPEQLKHVLKDGRIPFDDDLRAAVDDILDGYYNMGAYGGRVKADQGKCRMDVYNANLHTKRVATAEDLNLMLMRTTRYQTIGRKGVQITVSGVKLYYWDAPLLLSRQGQKVYVRYNPEDLSEIRIYDEENRFIQTAPIDRECRLTWGASKEELQTAQRKKAAVDKAVKALAEDYTSRLTPAQRIDALDLMLRHSQAAKADMVISDGKVLEPVRANEKHALTAVPPQKGGKVVEIDTDRMLRNAAKRISN